MPNYSAPLRSSARFRVFCGTVFALLASTYDFAGTIRVPQDQRSIQAGIDAAGNGDTVLVSPGTYYENINFNGKAITVASVSGPAATVIDGGNKSSVVTFNHHEGRGSVLSGFTVQNAGEPATRTYVAGVLVWVSAPTISGNVITDNTCGGIYILQGAPLVQNNTVTRTRPASLCSDYLNNSGVQIVGGYASATLWPIIANNVIENNPSSGVGFGGIAMSAAGAHSIENNIIRNNYSGFGGAGIFSINSNVIFASDNLIYGNSSLAEGSGIYIAEPDSPSRGTAGGVIANNTILGNTAASISGTVITSSAGPNTQVSLTGWFEQTAFVNNIVVGSPGKAALVCTTSPSSFTPKEPDFLRNDVWNQSGNSSENYSGTCTAPSVSYGNIFADPQFADSSQQDYRLMPGSPAIDVGDSTVPLPPKDLDGNDRILDGTSRGAAIVDLGAYEYSGTGTRSVVVTLLAQPATNIVIGQSVTLQVGVVETPASNRPKPTGVIRFLDGGTLLGTATLQSGNASLPTSFSVSGTHHLTAEYAGDTLHASGQAAVDLMVLGYTSVLHVSAPTTYAFQKGTLAVSVTSPNTSTPPDGGTVLVTTGSTVLGTAINNAGAFSTLPFALPAGHYPLTLSFTGSAEYAPATDTSQAIDIAPDATALTVSGPQQIQHGGAADVRATVHPVHSSIIPIGHVTLSDGATVLDDVVVDADGSALFHLAGLAGGDHVLHFNYAPLNAHVGNLSQSSASASVHVDPLDFTIAVDPFSLQMEHHTVIHADLASVGLFEGTVRVSCGNLPPHAQCLFDHGDAAQLRAGEKVSLDIYFETSDVRGYKAAVDPLRPLDLRFALVLLPCSVFAFRKRRTARRFLVLFLAVAAAGCLSGCSGLYPGYTPPGTYTVEFTASGGGITHTTTTTVTVTR